MTLPVTAVTIKEGKTTAPKHYTEDTLLSAMETAGAKDMPEDAERKGIWSYVKKKYKLNMPFLGWLTLPKLLLFPLTLHNTPPHIDQAKDIHNDCGSALYYKMFRYIQIPTYMHAGS